MLGIFIYNILNILLIKYSLVNLLMLHTTYYQLC